VKAKILLQRGGYKNPVSSAYSEGLISTTTKLHIFPLKPPAKSRFLGRIVGRFFPKAKLLQNNFSKSPCQMPIFGAYSEGLKIYRLFTQNLAKNTFLAAYLIGGYFKPSRSLTTE
jgi:hypothetical protein